MAIRLRKLHDQVMVITGITSGIGLTTARMAAARFGRIDTWVNNAGISVFGRLEEVKPEDRHRLFQTNFWGTINGSLDAVRRMKQRGGGAIINVGSEVSERSIPMQGM
ncbi:SDR family NAD(P)-dependent oxidoreductase [Massilia sp. X63]|uniref:SDR family NAD(P)-dependent oxidoreductase n=1 Tax=Massilia sp. X63 TaxID=3237285 RepID=UPI0034DD5A62